MATGTIPLPPGTLHTGNKDWKSTPANSSQWYAYEGANTTTLDLPNANVFVCVTIANANRGIAVAIKWADNATAVWINRRHDSWKGWERVDKYA